MEYQLGDHDTGQAQRIVRMPGAQRQSVQRMSKDKAKNRGSELSLANALNRPT